MATYNKISELVSIKTFEPVINLQWANNTKDSLNLLNSYIITEEIAEHFEKILESITLRRSPERLKIKGGDVDPGQVKRSFIIRGQYGTGKSYFLVVLSSLMESVYNGNYDELMDKFKNFPNITYHLKVLKENDRKLYIVRINGEEEINKGFDDVVQESIINSFDNEFGEHYFESSYSKALKTLENYKKGDLWTVIEKNLSKLDMDYEELESGLRNRKSEYLNKYKKLIQKALSQDINIHKDNINNFIEEASKYVKTKGFSGILLVVDELSAYLKSSQEDKRINKDLAHLQTIAESSSYKRNNDLFFVISMHIDLKNFLDNIMTNEDDINKVTGRFEALNLNFESGNELIKNLIIIDKSKLKSVRDNMKQEFIKLENIDGPDYRNYYPMHPMSLSYLKDITENFAQKERTIFQFIASEIKGKKLREDIFDENKKLNLVKIDSIYNFFKDEINQKRSDVTPSINETLNLCENELEEKIAKALIISKLTVYGDTPSSSSRLSLEEISQLMLVNESKVKPVLDKFTNNYRSNIVYDQLDEKYEFVHTGSSRINLDGLIKIEIDKLNPDNVLKKFIKDTPGSNIRREYNVEPKRDITPVERTIKGQEHSITSLTNLKNKSSLSRKGDGTINFIIPKFTEGLNSIDEKDFVDILKDCNDNVSIAIPKTFNINEENILRIEALERVLGHKEVQNDDNMTKKVQHEIQRLRRSIAREIKGFANFDNFKFIFKEGPINLKNESELYKYMLDRYYTKFPKIDVERISGRSSTNRLIDNVISKGEIHIPENSTKEEYRQVKETLVPLGLAKITDHVGGQKAKMSRPSKKDDINSKEIWDLVVSGDYNTKQLVDKLEASPYGLKDFIVEIYLSSALYHESIRIIKDKSYLQNNSSQLSNIGASKANIVEVSTVVSLDNLNKVKTIWDIFNNIKKKDRLQNQFDPEGKINIMNLRIDLSQYLSDFVTIMEGKESLYKLYNINIKEITKLNELIEKARKNFVPDDFILDFIAIPEKIYEEGFKSSTYKLEELLKGIKDLDSSMPKIESITNRMKSLKENENELKYIENSEEALEEINKNYKSFVESPLNIEVADQIEEKQIKLIEKYNNKFNVAHKKFWNGIKEMQQEIKMSKDIRLLEILEKFNFRNIRSKDNAISNLMRFKICPKSYDNMNNKKISVCNCITYQTTLQILEESIKEVDGLLKETYKVLDSVISSYVEKLRELNVQKKDGVKFEDYLNEKEDDLYLKYQKVFNELLTKYSDLDESSKNELEKIIYPVNDFLKESVEPPVIKTIDYVDFNNIIDKKVNHVGVNSIELEKYIDIIRDAWKEIEGNYDKIKL